MLELMLQVCFSAYLRIHAAVYLHVVVLCRCHGWVGVGQLDDVAVTLLRYIFQSDGEISHPQECQHWGLDYHIPQCIPLYITIQ